MTTPTNDELLRQVELPNKFFVNGIAYFSDQTALLGSEIKTIAGVPPYHLFYEVKGSPDVFVGDGEAVRIDGETKHFFASPAGTTFG